MYMLLGMVYSITMIKRSNTDLRGRKEMNMNNGAKLNGAMVETMTNLLKEKEIKMVAKRNGKFTGREVIRRAATRYFEGRKAKGYLVSDLARKAGTSVESMSKKLENIEKREGVKSFRIGDRVFFSI
jgi:hypothetical protein